MIMSSSLAHRSVLLAAALAGVFPAVPSAGQDFQDAPAFTRARSEPVAAEGALFLLLPVGAQGVAMGRAMTAMPTQEASFWNPAGLAGLEQGRFMVYRGEHLAGTATAFSLLFTPNPVGTLGISYQLLDIGEQDLTDDTGNVLGRIGVRNHLAVASFATRLIPQLDVGLNFKMVQFRVSCSGQCADGGVTATTFALDVGIQSRPTEAIPLRLGVMLAHMGPSLQVINAAQSDPLPTRVRVSGAYEMLGHFIDQSDLDLWLTLELEDRMRELGSPSLYIGSEFSAGRAGSIFVRAGYVAGDVEQVNGAAVGAGLRYQSFDVAIAKSLADSGLEGDTEPVHITFAVLF
jgi:hypothetical protein